MQSLLEPDPTKRPGVEEAMKDKWLNEGFASKIVNSETATSENRQQNLRGCNLVFGYDRVGAFSILVWFVCFEIFVTSSGLSQNDRILFQKVQ